MFDLSDYQRYKIKEAASRLSLGTMMSSSALFPIFGKEGEVLKNS